MQIGAQLWLFNALLDENEMETVLIGLQEAGYTCVETLYGKPPQHRTLLERLGLRCYATHIALAVMPPGNELADFAGRMGAETICVSGLLKWHERTADDYQRSADALNEWGKRLQAEGIALHYHNHEFEFAAVEGETTGMEILLSRFDPDVVSLCFDVGWAAIAGSDPVAFATKHAPRIKTLHLRDFQGTVSVPLGAGNIDLSRMVATLPALPDLQAVLVEQDPGTETPLSDMVTSRRFLKERFGL